MIIILLTTNTWKVITDDQDISGYTCEPEFSKEELIKRGVDVTDIIEDKMIDDSEDSENDLDSSRLENLHWCTCTHCCIMPLLVECKCCLDVQIC